MDCFPLQVSGSPDVHHVLRRVPLQRPYREDQGPAQEPDR